MLECPSGPLGFGPITVDARQLETLRTLWGALRVITPTLCAMDRLAAFCHWRDRQCWAQALLVARSHPVGWPQLQAWAELEGFAPPAWERFYVEARST